ncbi:DsbA family protein [Reinekea marinisedimentorum]|uniref:Protein-disulfide isomerase n=1 Tax=Reinekea marinisedimentorum TaxID=230495 RepID=A0A4R3IDY5_9GAMM|nr:DsbA family protein [Reinekea marinisedimentorum]TCS43967.1 protein-disulfide isomerase [Reinekea marinisedimentorum]
MKAVKFIQPVALAASLFAAASFTQAEEFSKSEIEEIVHQYILEHPEVIAEAIHKLQQRAEQEKAQKEAESLQQMTDMLINNPIDPVGGNSEGSLTIVEFFDYNCGYCKRANDTLQALIADNPDLKVVYKEWPILSESSGTAARIALAANLVYPEKYEALHRALLSTRSLRSENDVWKVIEQQQLDRAAIEAKLNDESIEQHISETSYLAQQLGITGTPAFVVGGRILKGAYPQAEIQKAIDEAKDS